MATLAYLRAFDRKQHIPDKNAGLAKPSLRPTMPGSEIKIKAFDNVLKKLRSVDRENEIAPRPSEDELRNYPLVTGSFDPNVSIDTIMDDLPTRRGSTYSAIDFDDYIQEVF